MQLIEHYLPQWQFEEQHSLLAPRLSPAQIYAALVPALQAPDPWAQAAITLRELPARLQQTMGLSTKPLPKTAFGFHSFTPLGQVAEQEVAYGLAGEFWRANFGLHATPDAQAFASLQGVPKLVLNLCLHAQAQGSLLVTHTRVYCPTEAQRKRFTPYWYFIRPVSGLLRRRLLRNVVRYAQSLPTTRA